MRGARLCAGRDDRRPAAQDVRALDVGAYDLLAGQGTPATTRCARTSPSTAACCCSWTKFAAMRTGDVPLLCCYSVLQRVDVVFLRDPVPYLMCPEEERRSGGEWASKASLPVRVAHDATYARQAQASERSPTPHAATGGLRSPLLRSERAVGRALVTISNLTRPSSATTEPVRDALGHASSTAVSWSSRAPKSTRRLLFVGVDLAGRRFVDEWHRLVQSARRARRGAT